MKLPQIPKDHPLLPLSAKVMLQDCRQIVARELKKKRKIERLGGVYECKSIYVQPWDVNGVRMKGVKIEKA